MTTISAKIVMDSVSPSGARLTTMQLHYPRRIHVEFLTHRAFSRNSSSNRAIPVRKLLDAVASDPVIYEVWGSTCRGMVSGPPISAEASLHAKELWETALDSAMDVAERLWLLGIHKEIVNDILEPFQHIDTIVTATEWDNFLTQRLDKAAHPFMQKLAESIKYQLDNSAPTGRTYHLPYVTNDEWNEYDPPVLAKMSVARCARVSYLNHDQSEPVVARDITLHDRLLYDKHLSPFEHVAYALWGNTASKNFTGWEQYRTRLERNNVIRT